MTPVSNYPCLDGGRHQWPRDFDDDGWQRCVRGCGCGRPRLGRWPGSPYPPEEVGSAIGRDTGAPQTPQEPILCVSPNGWHSWPIRPDADGWLRCVRVGCGAGRRSSKSRVTPVHEVPAFRRPPPDEEDTWQPLPTYAPLTPQDARDCSRCGARELVERDIDGDIEFVCVGGHRRYSRPPAEYIDVARTPSINGLLLG